MGGLWMWAEESEEEVGHCPTSKVWAGHEL